MLHRHTISFKSAFAGVAWALKTQPNFKIHLFLAALSIAGGWMFEVTYGEFLLIILLITIGLSIEMINTSIEATNDAIDEKIRPEIKIAKDTAAGAMLFFAIGSTVIACIMFLPKIF